MSCTGSSIHGSSIADGTDTRPHYVCRCCPIARARASIAKAVESLQAEQIKAAIEELPPEQREAITLAFFNGLTHQEIAERTRVPLGTVKGRMRLGLRKLRQHLVETDWEPS